MSILQRLARSSKVCLFLVLALCIWSAPAAAQCPLPDQLDGGPCCTQAFENLSIFKKVTVNSLDICWRDCGIDFVGPSRAVWTPLKVLPATGPDCGMRYSRLDLLDPVGALKWTGTLQLLYSRTWAEMKPSGTPLQVWRFLVNGYLRPTPIVAPAPGR